MKGLLIGTLLLGTLSSFADCSLDEAKRQAI